MSSPKKLNIVLASTSPRRSFLLNEIGIDHRVVKFDFDENIPAFIQAEDSSLYIAENKNQQIPEKQENTAYLTADTVVILNNEVIGKPKDFEEAFVTLKKLSNNSHSVITGVCISSLKKTISFKCVSKVSFRKLEDKEILYYIEKYKPYDKAGSYGIQEWIGNIGIEKIDGSYTNIMGLPTDLVYNTLKDF